MSTKSRNQRISSKKLLTNESDWATEESQSTSSSSGGGGSYRAPSGGGRQNEWSGSDSRQVNDTSRSNQSLRRAQQRRHHTITGESATMHMPRPSMDLESHLPGQRSHSMYQPPPSVYDDDPGIMSEVETSATGFRRTSKARSSLPIVRTPSKTQERPLGLVFLQYQNETKRALLPNEITSADTVKALFVRSFPKQLTMEYLDSHHIRIYIHDPAKDMFYELEDLRDIRDRSVLRIYEQDVNGGGVYNAYDQDLSYFSEPEFDSDYQHQHIHKTKASKSQPPLPAGYYTALSPYSPASRTQTLPHGASLRSFSPTPSERQKTQTLPPAGYSQTLPRGMHLLYSSPAPPTSERVQMDLLVATGSGQAPPKPQRSFQQAITPMTKGVRSTPPPSGPPPSIPSPRSAQPRSLVPVGQSLPMSPERRHEPQGAYRAPPERPYSVAGQVSYHVSPERRYDTTYHSSPERRTTQESGYLSSPERRIDQRTFSNYTPTSYEECIYGERVYGTRSGSVTPVIDEEARIRMEYMERQLLNLTGLVQKALTPGPTSRSQQIQHIPTRDNDIKDNREKQEIMEADIAKLSLKEREVRTSGGKPAPPPKPASLSGAPDGRQHGLSKDLHITPELYAHLRYLRKQTKDLRLEVRNLRRIAQAQAVTAKETVRETCLRIKSMLAASQIGEDQVCAERLRVSREEDLYRQDVTRLEKDLSELESQVEELRSNVINRRCRVNMCDVEGMALVLSRASKTVADLKARFPNLQDSLKTVMSAEMEVVVREEKFLKEEPDRLENALRRCKKLTGTLVTLKRLASVQEQRHTGAHHPPEKSSSSEGPHSDGEVHTVKTIDSDPHTVIHVPPDGHQRAPRTENALDALLDELQTFTKPVEQKRDVIPGLTGPQHRLPSYPSADSPVRTPTHGLGPAPPPGPKKVTSTAGSAFHAPGTITTKLQVSDAGQRHSVNLSPSHSPVPDGKRSPQPPEMIIRVSVGGTKHIMLETTQDSSITTNRKIPPPPPPRTTSRSPITSPTNPVPPPSEKQTISNRENAVFANMRSNSDPSGGMTNAKIKRAIAPSAKEEGNNNNNNNKEGENMIRTSAISDDSLRREQLSSNSSSSESVNSQEGLQLAALQAGAGGTAINKAERKTVPPDGASEDGNKKSAPPTPPRTRQELLEQRHQELLKKQKQLQEQYARLQQLQRGQILQRFSPPRSASSTPLLGDLKKTGSESNILSKAALSLTPASGSLTHLAVTTANFNTKSPSLHNTLPITAPPVPAKPTPASTKIFETDIL